MWCTLHSLRRSLSCTRMQSCTAQRQPCMRNSLSVSIQEHLLDSSTVHSHPETDTATALQLRTWSSHRQEEHAILITPPCSPIRGASQSITHKHAAKLPTPPQAESLHVSVAGYTACAPMGGALGAGERPWKGFSLEMLPLLGSSECLGPCRLHTPQHSSGGPIIYSNLHDPMQSPGPHCGSASQSVAF